MRGALQEDFRLRVVQALTALSLVVACPRRPLPAQGTASPSGIGFHVAFYDLDNPTRTAVGAHILLPLPANFAFYPAVQSYLVDVGDVWSMSSTFRWTPRAVGLTPYIGLGPAWTHDRTGGQTKTKVGVLCLVGAETRLRSPQLFMEFRLLTSGAVTSEFAIGFRLSVGRRAPGD